MNGGVLDQVLTRLERVLDECPELLGYGLSDTEIVEALPRLEGVLARLDGKLRLPVVGEADTRDLWRRVSGCSSTVNWLAQWLRLRPARAAELVRTARALHQGEGLGETARALSDGTIGTDHAGVIARCLDKLPSDVDSGDRGLVESILLRNAVVFDPQFLTTIGDTVYAQIAPEAAEEQERRELERQERRAARSRWLSWHGTGIAGVSELRFRCGTDTRVQVETLLEPLTEPMDPEATGTDTPDTRPHQRRAGDAMTELIDHWAGTTPEPADEAEPDTDPALDLDGDGGEGRRGWTEGSAQNSANRHHHRGRGRGRERRRRPSMILTVDYDVVRRRIRGGSLNTGQKLAPSTLARLACESDLIPVWMGRDLRATSVAATCRFFGDTSLHTAALYARALGKCALLN